MKKTTDRVRKIKTTLNNKPLNVSNEEAEFLNKIGFDLPGFRAGFSVVSCEDEAEADKAKAIAKKINPSGTLLPIVGDDRYL